MKQASSYRRPAQFLLSYILTITVILQIRVTNDVAFSNNEPFLTHFDLIGNDGGSASKHPQGYCSRNAVRSLKNLIAKINEDPNNNALVPLDIVNTGRTLPSNSNATINNTPTTTMEGLHLSSFRNKRIAFLGDSTLFYLAKYLVSMLRHEDAAGGEGSAEYDKMNLGQADKFVLTRKTIQLKGTDAPPPYMNGDTWFQWYGMSGNSHGRTEELIDNMFASAYDMNPEVVVANMAFHWFHLCGYSEKMCPTPKDSPIIARWLHYKETWLQRVYDFAINVNAKVLLFKTANFICASARTGDWATGDELYQKFDNATLSGCVKTLEPLAKDLYIGSEEIEKYCKYAQFTDVGSKYLNEQMVEFVNSQDLGSGPIIGMYNDHDVESCSTTADAIHHKSGITMRLRLLANTIEMYSKCSIA